MPQAVFEVVIDTDTLPELAEQANDWCKGMEAAITDNMEIDLPQTVGLGLEPATVRVMYDPRRSRSR